MYPLANYHGVYDIICNYSHRRSTIVEKSAMDICRNLKRLYTIEYMNALVMYRRIDFPTAVYHKVENFKSNGHLP